MSEEEVPFLNGRPERSRLTGRYARALTGLERHGWLASVLVIAAATVVFVLFRPFLGSEQWGWPYLLVVGFVAGVVGVRPAVFSAILAFLCWNFFFIQPYYTFHVAQTQDLVHLSAFLIIAVAGGLQTARLRASTNAARQQEARTAALYRLSSGMVLDVDPSEMASMVDAEVVKVLGARGACVWMRAEDSSGELMPNPPTPRAPDRDSQATVETLLASAERGPLPLERGGNTYLRLETSSGTAGVLEVGGLHGMDEEATLFASSVAHLVAVYLEKRRIGALVVRALAAEEAERLRTTLISSVSHELKTPVASLMASVTDLLERDREPAPEQLRANLAAMRGDLSRLDRSIGDLLDLSRLEAHAWTPKPYRFEAGELIGTVMSDLSRTTRERVDFEVPPDIPTIRADFVQSARALRHVLDNALQYSDGRVTVGGGTDGNGFVAVWVQDSGPGIPHSEQELVFDKFYRGTAGRQSRSSTGLGLSLAREIISANGGRVRIENPATKGTRLVLTLPIDQET